MATLTDTRILEFRAWQPHAELPIRERTIYCPECNIQGNCSIPNDLFSPRYRYACLELTLQKMAETGCLHAAYFSYEQLDAITERDALALEPLPCS